MKLVHVVKTYLPFTKGGIEEVVRGLSEQYLMNGHEVSVISCSPSITSYTVISVEHVECHFFPVNFSVMSSPFSYQMISKVKYIISQHDIAIMHTPWPYLDFLQIFFPRKVPFVVFHHADSISTAFGGSVERVYNFFHRAFLSRSSKIITTSPSYLSSSKYLTRFKSKVKVFPLGVDPSNTNIVEGSSGDDFLSSINVVNNNFVLFLGALRHYKGLDDLILAAQKSSRKFIVAGNGLEYERYACQVKGLDNIEFIGKVSDKEKKLLLRSCRLLILPSINRAEAFGVVLLEAMSFSKPVITTELNTGTSYVNVNEETGYVVPVNHIDAIVDKIELLFRDDNVYGKLSSNARLRIEESFDIKKISTDQLEFFAKILDEKRSEHE